MVKKRNFSISEITRLLEAESYIPVDANADVIRLENIAGLSEAMPVELSFLANPKYAHELKTTQAGAVIIAPKDVDLAPPELPLIIHDDPYLCFAKILTFVHPMKKPKRLIAKSAVIARSASLASGVVIGENSVIGESVHIDTGTVIKASVTITEGAKIGQHCIIHEGAIIGADGFGNAWDKKNGCWVKVPQIGSVCIGDDTEIGSNTVIDRGALKNTLIGRNVRIDNLVQIAHNVEIGDHTAVASQTGIAGSTKVGKNCIIAGQVGIIGHLTICDHVILTAGTAVSSDIDQPGVYSAGITAKPISQWRRNLVGFHRLAEILKRLQKVEKQLKNKA